MIFLIDFTLLIVVGDALLIWQKSTRSEKPCRWGHLLCVRVLDETFQEFCLLLFVYMRLVSRRAVSIFYTITTKQMVT